MNKIPATIGPERVTAIVDTREQLPLNLAPLRSTVGTLVTGDYSVVGLENVIAIERKSLPDLLACVAKQRERFEKEIQRLLAYQVRGLVIESTWPEIEAGRWNSKVTSAAAIGSLIGWAARGVPIFMTETHERAGRFVARILYTTARRRYQESRELLSRTLHPAAEPSGTL